MSSQGVRRLATALGAVASLMPVALVGAMVTTTPPSASVVPTVRIASAEGPIRLTPDKLGAVRAEDGLHVDRDRLREVVAELAQRFSRPADPGGYTMTEAGVTFRGGSPGAELDREEAERVLLRALRGSSREQLPLVAVAATAPEYAIVVKLGQFRLELYRQTDLLKTYPVGVGLPRYDTPTGEYKIKSKSANPTWWNPGSSWSKGMPRYVPPGPRNPLGTRAMRLDRDLLAIHGTPHPSTVGRRSSHGCMRMRREHVEELFEIVPVGTPVFVYS